MSSHIDPFFHSALSGSSIAHLENDNSTENHNFLLRSKTFLHFEGGWGGITLLVYR